MRPMELIVVKKIRLTGKVQKVVADRRKAGMCIACGEVPPDKREICHRCYGRYYSKMPSKAHPVKRARYEAAMMAEGLIGENRQGSNGKLRRYEQIAASVGGGE
jgi:hypothetical protein